jgi:hypothetical protein
MRSRNGVGGSLIPLELETQQPEDRRQPELFLGRARSKPEFDLGGATASFTTVAKTGAAFFILNAASLRFG